jgi:hypothetical protein
MIIEALMIPSHRTEHKQQPTQQFIGSRVTSGALNKQLHKATSLLRILRLHAQVTPNARTVLGFYKSH